MSDIKPLIERFVFEKILNKDPVTKSIVILGQIDGQNAIVSLEKSNFSHSEGTTFEVRDNVSESVTINHNDVYYWSNVLLQQDLEVRPGAKLNLIYPATETHIRKYGYQASHYVVETPEMYTKYVVPYIETQKGKRIQWVYNILFEGKESETFVHHDKDLETGFVLLPDMKWDTISMDSLYLCCIVNRKDISSIRDLNSSHVDWLVDLQKKLKKHTQEAYDIETDQLRIFVHYHPSYYHFHLHIVNIRHSGLGNGIAVGKAILLDDVIENIKMKSDYYATRSIGFILGENHGLWEIDGYREGHLAAQSH